MVAASPVKFRSSPIPILVFWLLDSFYLQQERRFKALYREVSELSENEIDSNLDTRKVKYTDDEANKICFCKCLFSVSEVLFYVALAVALLALIIVLKVF